MNQKKVAVFGDLTALFSARSALKKNINYNHIDLAIKKLFKINSFATANWYTLYHPDNKSQVEFIKTLQLLNWKIITKHPSEIRRNSSNTPTDYRFDAQIAYDIGESSVDSEYDQIVVVSDSIELLRPLKLATEFDLNVSLIFFNEAMDRRWWKPLDDSRIQFTDLSSLLYSNCEELDAKSERF